MNEKAYSFGRKVGHSLRSVSAEGRDVWREARAIADKAKPVTETYPYKFGQSELGRLAIEATPIGTAMSAANVVRGVSMAGEKLSSRQRLQEGAVVLSSAALAAVDMPLGVEIAVGTLLSAAVKSKK